MSTLTVPVDRPYLPVGDHLTADLAFAVIAHHADDTRCALDELIAALAAVDVPLLTEVLWDVPKIMRYHGQHPRQPNEANITLANITTPGTYGLDEWIGVRLTWETGIVAANVDYEVARVIEARRLKANVWHR